MQKVFHGIFGLLFIFITTSAFAVNQLPGSQYIYTGYGAKEVSMGYLGISEMGSIDGVSFNPASLGDVRRLANSLTIGGIGGPNLLIAPGVALPTEWGVLGVNGLYTGSGAPNSLSSLLGAELSLAKPITENLFWGVGLKYFSAAMNPNSDWILGMDMGVILRNKTEGSGFGLFDPSYGLALKNIGKTATLGSYDSFPGMGIGGGASAALIKVDNYQLRAIGDVTVPFNPFNLVLGAGFENVLFDMFKIRLGYTFSSPTSGISSVGPFFFGGGVSAKIKLKDSTDIDVSYGIQQQNFNENKTEWVHFIGVNVAWGYVDEQKPEAKITPNVTYFSPNFDGIQDEVKLALDVRDNQLVDGWQLDILDKNQSTVKSFKSIEKLQLRNLTFDKFLNQVISRKQQVEIPKEIAWNGQDEKGSRLPDGEYYYVLKAWDENKNTNITEPAKIVLDTVVPKLEISSPAIFSPNGDGIKDELTVAVKSSDVESIDSVAAEVSDASGNIVKKFDFKNTAPDKAVWDGKDDSGKPVPEGLYTFRMFINNPAGNHAESIIPNIRLVTNYQKASALADADAFSPAGQGARSTVTFRQNVSDSAGLLNWTLKVTDKSGNTVKEWTGQNTLLNEIVWDGKDKGNKVLQDGIYQYALELNFDSGNHPVSEKKNIKLRSTPPQISIKPEYLSFSPNGDGKQDTITFINTVEGEPEDSLDVKITDPSGNPVYYSHSQLKDFPKSFTWNGLDKDLKPLPEGKYTYEIDGSDTVGNKNTVTVKDIYLKTGLEKVAVQSDVPAISPTNAAAVQKAVFIPTVTSRDGIVSFTLDISAEDKSVVKSFKSSNFVDKFEWDGRDDSGKVVKDGAYTYALRVKYNYGDEPASSPKTIRVDSIPPEISLEPEGKIFSPNGDGRKETFLVLHKVKASPGDSFTGSILDESGKPVKTYRWTDNVPEGIVWDGKDNSGKPAPEGIYKYQLTGTDPAQNKTTATAPSIKLVRTFEKATLTSDITAFSPNGDKTLDSIQFSPALSSTNDLAESSLTIYNAAGKAVRKFVKKNALDNSIEWNGSDDTGKPLSDGYYTAILLAEYSSGNEASASLSNIILSRNPPSYKLTISPAVFTPDGDGEDDTLYLNLELSALTGVKDWEMDIYKKLDDGGRGPLFKKFQGSGNFKKLLEWNGMSDDGQDLVEAVQDYELELKASDALGNKLTNVLRNITVGVLVEKTPEGLRIRVSSINFETSRANLIGNSYKNLDKVIFILGKIMSDPQKYGLPGKYKIEVSGHTDDVPGPTADYNQKLSERRAKSVYDYLIQKDIDPKILTSVGYGESRPYKIITPNMSKEKRDEYRARNRRVEFFIRK